MEYSHMSAAREMSRMQLIMRKEAMVLGTLALKRWGMKFADSEARAIITHKWITLNSRWMTESEPKRTVREVFSWVLL